MRDDKEWTEDEIAEAYERYSRRTQEQLAKAHAAATSGLPMDRRDTRDTYTDIALPDYTTCVFGPDGDANLLYCSTKCPATRVRNCHRRAYRGLLISTGVAHDGHGEVLSDHVDDKGYVMHPGTNTPLIDPATGRRVRIVLPELWQQAHDEAA